jgi:hypothetical protein
MPSVEVTDRRYDVYCLGTLEGDLIRNQDGKDME